MDYVGFFVVNIEPVLFSKDKPLLVLVHCSFYVLLYLINILLIIFKPYSLEIVLCSFLLPVLSLVYIFKMCCLNQNPNKVFTLRYVYIS